MPRFAFDPEARAARFTRSAFATGACRVRRSTRRSLRIKLQNDYRHPRFIATVPGEGYRFIPTFSNRGWAGEPATREPATREP
ncbi:MAG TPA: hypothetical protein VIK38_02455 [Coriobacteriia bacterium]